MFEFKQPIAWEFQLCVSCPTAQLPHIIIRRSDLSDEDQALEEVKAKIISEGYKLQYVYVSTAIYEEQDKTVI